MLNTGEKKCVRACGGRKYRYLDNEVGVNKLIPMSFQIVSLVKRKNRTCGINTEHKNCILLFFEET